MAECTWAYLALLYNEGSSITSVCCRERPTVYGSVFGLPSRFPRRCEHTLPTAYVTPQRLLAHHWRRKVWPRVTVSSQGPCKGILAPTFLPFPPIPGWVCMTSRQKHRWQSPLRPGLGSQSVWLLDDLLGSGCHAARQFCERPRGQELRASHHCICTWSPGLQSNQV